MNEKSEIEKARDKVRFEAKYLNNLILSPVYRGPKGSKLKHSAYNNLRVAQEKLARLEREANNETK